MQVVVNGHKQECFLEYVLALKNHRAQCDELVYTSRKCHASHDLMLVRNLRCSMMNVFKNYQLRFKCSSRRIHRVPQFALLQSTVYLSPLPDTLMIQMVPCTSLICLRLLSQLLVKECIEEVKLCRCVQPVRVQLHLDKPSNYHQLWHVFCEICVLDLESSQKAYLFFFKQW